MASLANLIDEIMVVIADEATWTQGGLAADRAGTLVFPEDPGAIRWCVDGAWGLVKYRHLDEPAADMTRVSELLEKAGRRLFGAGYVWVNDHLGHRAVLRVCREARELAAEEDRADLPCDRDAHDDARE